MSNIKLKYKRGNFITSKETSPGVFEPVSPKSLGFDRGLIDVLDDLYLIYEELESIKPPMDTLKSYRHRDLLLKTINISAHAVDKINETEHVLVWD